MFIRGESSLLLSKRIIAVAALALGALVQSASAQESRLTVASFGGPLGTAIKDLFKPFEQAKNVTIRWVPGSGAENVAKAAVNKDTSEFDVIMADELSYDLGAKQGLFLSIDPAIVTHYADIVPEARLGHGALFGFYFTGIFYRTDEFAKNNWAAPSSWRDFYRREFCGRIGVAHPNNTMGLGMVAMLAKGDLGKINEGIAEFAKLKDCIPVLEPTPSKLEEKITLGEYVIGAHGQHRMLPLIQKGLPIKFVSPKEGAMLSGGVAAVAKGSANPKLAQEFVNWFVSPQAQKVLMETALYVPSNKTVDVPANLIALGLPDREGVKRLIFPNPGVVNQGRREWIRSIERAMAR